MIAAESSWTNPMHDFRVALNKLVKCLYIYIGETPIRGYGIFAAKDFACGDVIVIDEDGDYYDNALSLQELLRRGYDLSRDCFQVGKEFYLLPNGNLDDLINHSCDPTVGLRLTASGYRVIALRDIAMGEELTYDYSTYIGSDSPEQLDCTCGSSLCRGRIGSFATLPDAQKQRYLEAGVVGIFCL